MHKFVNMLHFALTNLSNFTTLQMRLLRFSLQKAVSFYIVKAIDTEREEPILKIHQQPDPNSEPKTPGAFQRFFEVLGESPWSLVKLNLLFILTSIPIVTFGPSLTALNACAAELVRGDIIEERPFHTYRRVFSSCFLRALPWGLLALAANAVLGTALFYYGRLANESWLFVPFTALSLLALLFLWGILIHLFPMLAESDQKNLFQKAALYALERMGKTLTALLLSCILLAVQIFLFPVSLPIILALGIVLPVTICVLAYV